MIYIWIFSYIVIITIVEEEEEEGEGEEEGDAGPQEVCLSETPHFGNTHGEGMEGEGFIQGLRGGMCYVCLLVLVRMSGHRSQEGNIVAELRGF